MATQLDKDAVRDAYYAVRDDNDETTWAVFKFEATTIGVESTGSDFDEFRSKFSDDERGFGYLRVTTGDELSVRSKFVFLTWVGHNVSALKRGKMSTDKGVIKSVILNFALELTFSEQEELSLEHIREECIKAGGANYGTGSRD